MRGANRRSIPTGINEVDRELAQMLVYLDARRRLKDRGRNEIIAQPREPDSLCDDAARCPRGGMRNCIASTLPGSATFNRRAAECRLADFIENIKKAALSTLTMRQKRVAKVIDPPRAIDEAEAARGRWSRVESRRFARHGDRRSWRRISSGAESVCGRASVTSVIAWACKAESWVRT